jgi:hypothetical protein
MSGLPDIWKNKSHFAPMRNGGELEYGQVEKL